MHEFFVGLGFNCGEKKKNILSAISEIKKIGSVEKISTIIETKPWGDENQEDFLNAVVEISFDGSAQELLENLQKIEQKLGRTKTRKWGPRVIDLDILFFGREKINEKNLKIPHPFWQERDFVLSPLAEIAPNFVPPNNELPIWKIAEEFRKKNLPPSSHSHKQEG